MLNGWATRTAQELDPTIRTWSEAFSFYNIPVSAYPELYQRAFDLRQSKMQSTGDAPQMDATLLVSQWTGQHGLQADLKQREVTAGRTLTGNAESICALCDGTGWMKIDPADWKAPVKRCTHGN